ALSGSVRAATLLRIDADPCVADVAPEAHALDRELAVVVLIDDQRVDADRCRGDADCIRSQVGSDAMPDKLQVLRAARLDQKRLIQAGNTLIEIDGGKPTIHRGLDANPHISVEGASGIGGLAGRRHEVENIASVA